MSDLHKDVAAQIDALEIRRGKPLAIIDADEVLFLFIEGLERFLNRRDLVLELKSFALTGNIKRVADGQPLDGVEVKRLLADFFNQETAYLKPVPGAAAALADISRRADIVVLSNVPLDRRQAREEALSRHGMPYPVIANIGAKGPAVAALMRRVKAPGVFPGVFIDDLPPNHTSVAEHAPEVFRLHMVAEPRLRPLIAPADAAHARHDDWPEALAAIAAALRQP